MKDYIQYMTHFCVRFQLFSAEGCNRDTFSGVLVRRQKSSVGSEAHSNRKPPLFLSCSALSCMCLCLCVSQEAADAQSFNSWQHEGTDNGVILYDVCILYTLLYAHLYTHMTKTLLHIQQSLPKTQSHHSSPVSNAAYAF